MRKELDGATASIGEQKAWDAVLFTANLTPPSGASAVQPLNRTNRPPQKAIPLNSILEFAPTRTSLARIGPPEAGKRAFAQQPGGDTGDTPGVAAAPVALAGGIVPGVARFMVMLSAHADVFGVGITFVAESMPMEARSVTAG